jgi:ferredoxin
MHQNGIIPEGSFGWQFAPASGLPADWFKGAPRGRDWRLGSAPFVLDREFRTTLGLAGAADGKDGGPVALAFRYKFEVERDLLGPEDRFILTLTSMDEGLSAWIDGKPIVPPPGTAGAEGGITVSRRKDRDKGWWEIEVELPSSCLRPGKNGMAVKVSPAAGASDRLLDLRLDRDEGATVKLVEEKAVVCDLCSAQLGQRPACVTACPHDAAMRVEALTQLPLQSL